MDASSPSPSTGQRGQGRHWQSDAVTASLAARLQSLENEVYRLTQLSDKKDNAIRLLLVMKSVMNRKLGQRGITGVSLFGDDNTFHTPYRQKQEQLPLSDFTFPPQRSPTHSLDQMCFGRAPVEVHSSSRYPSRRSPGSSYQNGVLTSQVDADMQQYEQELKEVFQDEIVAHGRVQKNVELVSNDLHNMFALEDYLESNGDLQLQIQRNKALREGLVNHGSGVELPDDSSNIRRHKTRMLEQRVLEDILLSKESKHEMALRLAQARSTAMISTAENATLKRLLNEMQVEKDLLTEQFHQEIGNAERSLQKTLVNKETFKSRHERPPIARNRYSERYQKQSPKADQLILAYEEGSNNPEHSESDSSLQNEQESDDDTSISEFIFTQNETENSLSQRKAVNDDQTELEQAEELHHLSTDIKRDAITSERKIKQAESPRQDADRQTKTEEQEDNQPGSGVEEDNVTTETEVQTKAVCQDADCQTETEEQEDNQPGSDVEEGNVTTETEVQTKAVCQDVDCQTETEEQEESQPGSDVEEGNVTTETEVQTKAVCQDADCQTETEEQEESQPGSDVEEDNVTTETEVQTKTVCQDADCQTETEEQEESQPCSDVEEGNVTTETEVQTKAVCQDVDCQTETEEHEESQPGSDVEEDNVTTETEVQTKTVCQDADCQTETEEQEESQPCSDVEEDNVTTETEVQTKAVCQDADCQTETEEQEDNQPCSDVEEDNVTTETEVQTKTVCQDADCQTETEEQEESQPGSDVEEGNVTTETEVQTSHVNAESISFKFESGCDAIASNLEHGILNDSMLKEVKVRATARAGERNSRLRKRQSRLQPFKYLFGSTPKSKENASQVQKKHNSSPSPRKRKLSLSGDDEIEQQQSRRNVTKGLGTSSEVFEQTYLNQIFQGVENTFTGPRTANESEEATKLGKEAIFEADKKVPSAERSTEIPPPASEKVSASPNEEQSSPSHVNDAKSSEFEDENNSEQSPSASEEGATRVVDAISEKPPNGSEASEPPAPEKSIDPEGETAKFEDIVYAKLMLRRERRLSMSTASSVPGKSLDQNSNASVEEDKDTEIEGNNHRHAERELQFEDCVGKETNIDAETTSEDTQSPQTSEAEAEEKGTCIEEEGAEKEEVGLAPDAAEPVMKDDLLPETNKQTMDDPHVSDSDPQLEKVKEMGKEEETLTAEERKKIRLREKRRRQRQRRRQKKQMSSSKAEEGEDISHGDASPEPSLLVSAEQSDKASSEDEGNHDEREDLTSVDHCGSDLDAIEETNKGNHSQEESPIQDAADARESIGAKPEHKPESTEGSKPPIKGGTDDRSKPSGGESATLSKKDLRERKYKEFLAMRVKVKSMLNSTTATSGSSGKELEEKKLNEGSLEERIEGEGEEEQDRNERHSSDANNNAEEEDDQKADSHSDEDEGEDGSEDAAVDDSVFMNPLNPLVEDPEGSKLDSNSDVVHSPRLPRSGHESPPQGSLPSVSPVSKIRNKGRKSKNNPLLAGKVSKRNSKLRRKSLTSSSDQSTKTAELNQLNEMSSVKMIHSPLYGLLHGSND